MAYIDPITGAYVEDGLNALPPGYNPPKPTDAANIARMRAQLNSEEALRQQQLNTQAKNKYLSNPASIVKYAAEHMPGAPIAQAALGMASDMFGQVLGIPYGIYQGIKSGEYGKSTGTAQKQAKALAESLQYTPPTQAGRDIYEGINKIPEAVTGSTMGIGMLPEIWGMPPRISPSDVQVMGARGINAAREIADIPRDFSAAQSGLTRIGAYDQPTYGARLQNVVEDIGDVMARRQSMRPEEGASPLSGFGTFTDIVPDPRMYAVKPKGGNWPTNLGSTLPLKEQGQLGSYLSSVQYNDPVAVFENQLKKYFPRAIDNRQLLHDWENFLNEYISNIDPEFLIYVEKNKHEIKKLKKEAADEFAKAYNAGSIGSEDLPEINKKLYSASQIEQTLPYYNSWVMGPFQKYITNQMGTGLTTDPLLQAIDESNLPLKEIFGFSPNPYLEQSAQSRRKDFIDRIYGYTNTPEKQAALENSVIGKITATSPQGIEYENALDASLYPKGPHSFKGNDGNTLAFPALNKINRDALITDFLSEPYDETGFQKIRSKVFTDLLSGKLDPNKLSNVTPATITRQLIKDKMAEFKEAQLNKQKAQDWIPMRASAMPTDMAFPDGSKMTIITPEMAIADENMTARDLGQITIDLNQCVGAGCRNTDDYSGHGPYVVPHTGRPPRGKVEYDKYGYLKRLKNGEIEIASLKDKNGVSQATVRLDLRKRPMTNRDKEGIIWDWVQQNHPDKLDGFNAAINTYGQERAISGMLSAFPELKEVLSNSPRTLIKSIGEMKGKDNLDVLEEFVPNMVEWLNKQGENLEDVRDLEHLPGVYDLNDHYTSIGRMIDKNQQWYPDTVEQFFETIEKEKALPRFFTKNEFALKATELGVNLYDEPKKENAVQQKEPQVEHQFNRLTELQIDVLKQNMEDYFADNLLLAPADMVEPYATDTSILLGNQRPEAKLPRIVHGDLVSMLLNQDNAAGGIRFILDRLQGPGYFENMPELTTPQLENILNIVVSWIERYPLAEPEPRVVVNQNQPRNELSPVIRAQLVEGMAHYFDNPNDRDFQAPPGEALQLIRILAGDQDRANAQLPPDMHERIVSWLLTPTQYAENIRSTASALERNPADFGLTESQGENLLNILTNWTERFPLP